MAVITMNCYYQLRTLTPTQPNPYTQNFRDGGTDHLRNGGSLRRPAVIIDPILFLSRCGKGASVCPPFFLGFF